MFACKQGRDGSVMQPTKTKNNVEGGLEMANEVTRRTLHAKTAGGRATGQSKDGLLKNPRVGACQLKDSATMMPLTVPCWESQGSGVIVGGQVCNWIMLRRRDQCTECTLDADLEVQRTVKTAELTAFSCLFRRIFGPTTL